MEVASLAAADCCEEGKALLPDKVENGDAGTAGQQARREKSGSSLQPDLCNSEALSQNRELS